MHIRVPICLPHRSPHRAVPWMGVWAWLLKWPVVLSEPRGLGVLGVTRMRSRSRSPKRSGNALVWSSSFCRCPAEHREPISSWFPKVSEDRNAALHWEVLPEI